MRNNKIVFSYLILLFFTLHSFPQKMDSTITLPAFIQHILTYHPYIQNINLQTIEKSKAYLIKSRGAFDPKIYHKFDEKYFQQKNYYSTINSGIKIPNWIGDIKAEYNYNTGIYLNASDYLPPNGLWSAGIHFPILKNLFIDERRWELKSSKVNLKIAEYENAYHIINFLIEALHKYWQWFEVYNKYLILKEATEISKQRLIATVHAVELGDLPIIDTIETSIQYNNFLLQLNITYTELQNAQNDIRYYLQNNNNKFELYDNINYIPQKFIPNQSENLIIDNYAIDSLINLHPLYQSYQLKLNNLYIEKRFRIEMLKPQLDVNYNFLLIPSHPNDIIFNANNYKWGIHFTFPMFIRKERAELKLVNLKIKEVQNDIQLKRTQIQIKSTNYYNLYRTYSNQFKTMNDLIVRYEKMLNAEKEKFFAGESSVFLVNARENYLLDAQIKRISFYSKLNLYKNLFQLSLGQIPQ